jgi:sedoheptulokinase
MYSSQAVIWDAGNQYSACEAVEITNATVPNLETGRDEQDVRAVISAAQRCVQRLPAVQLRNVESVGVCGQMHGVLLWKRDACVGYDASTGTYSVNESHVSNLITWQDARCTPEFVASLPRPSR